MDKVFFKIDGAAHCLWQASRADRQKIPDEFTEVAGFHRKHAIGSLRLKSKHLLEARERHGHIRVVPEIRERVPRASAAAIDSLAILRP